MNLMKRRTRRRFSDETGFTLVECLIAIVILLLGLLVLAQVLAFSVVVSKTCGRDATKATASAHDKMEELTALQFADTTTNVTVAAPYPADGVGLRAGGSIPPADPVAGYVDYLDTAGVRATAAAALYTRQWQIIDDSTQMKRIIVAVISKNGYKYGKAPTTTVVTYKTQ